MRGSGLCGKSIRAAGALAALILFFAVGARTETTNVLSDAEIQGRKLAQQLCDSQPAGNFTNNGVLQIRDAKGKRIEYPFYSLTSISNSQVWISDYSVTIETLTNQSRGHWLIITHTSNQANVYSWHQFFTRTNGGFHAVGADYVGWPPKWPQAPYDDALCESFGHSDFWLGDLGLEFFHWPQQKILPKTINLKRGRAYTLLESTNPNPSTNGYSRVLSWIDQETGGILEAEAYDVQGKLLKVFEPDSFEKVNGQWQLQEMEIRNVQTGSRTRLTFDLKK